MYRCPRCTIELPPNARFCNNCGFNPAQANIQPARPQQATQAPPQPAPNPTHQKIEQPLTPTPASVRPPEGRSPIPPHNRQPRSLGISAKARPTQENQPAVLSTPRDTAATPPPSVPTTPAASKEQRFTLTQRYIAEQETGYQPSFDPSANASARPATPEQAMQPRNPISQSGIAPQGIEAASTMIQAPPTPTHSQGTGSAMPQSHKSESGTGSAMPQSHKSESVTATSKAAEHWHNSWRNRQRAEAGPAIGITRGQALVPEPLMAMQHSIARMRAIIMPKNIKPESNSKKVAFWITLTLLLCLTGGLGTYIGWTYLPSAPSSTTTTTGTHPLLTIQPPTTSTIKPGQTLQLQGHHFQPGHTINFTLDDTPLTNVSVQSNNQGAFATTLAIPATWLAGSSMLQAQDSQNGPHAFLDLQILPTTTTMSNTTPLDLTSNELPIPTGLVFKTTTTHSNSTEQRITLTNTDTAPAQWSIAAVADNNLSWLLVNDHKTNGQLDIAGTDSLGISVNSIGLQSSTKPYTGRIIFTVGQKQAIIPVSLFVQTTTLEVVVNPNPIIAYMQAGGACKPATLTLINLSTQVVTWTANPFDVDKAHIHLDNQPNEQGTLDPSGLPNATKVVQITCIGAQVGEKLYHINVFYNSIEVNVPVSIRNG